MYQLINRSFFENLHAMPLKLRRNLGQNYANPQ